MRRCTTGHFRSSCNTCVVAPVCMSLVLCCRAIALDRYEGFTVVINALSLALAVIKTFNSYCQMGLVSLRHGQTLVSHQALHIANFRGERPKASAMRRACRLAFALALGVATLASGALQSYQQQENHYSLSDRASGELQPATDQGLAYRGRGLHAARGNPTAVAKKGKLVAPVRFRDGNWAEDYRELHREILAGHAPQRYVIAHGDRGLVDSLKGAITIFWYAVLSKRAFLMEIPKGNRSDRSPRMHCCARLCWLANCYLALLYERTHRSPRGTYPGWGRSEPAPWHMAVRYEVGLWAAQRQLDRPVGGGELMKSWRPLDASAGAGRNLL